MEKRKSDDKHQRFFKKIGNPTYVPLPKSDVIAMMLPGWELRSRIMGSLILLCRGYHGEFAVHQVKKQDKGDPDKFLPVTHSLIASMWQQIAISAFRKAGREISQNQRIRKTDGDGKPIDPLMPWHRIPLDMLRRALEKFESIDHLIVNATFPSLLSQDRRARREGWRDIDLVIRECMTYQECLSHQMVVPIHELSKPDRQRLAGKSFIFWLVKHEPATLEALMRKSDAADLEESEIHEVLSPQGKRILKIMRKLGLHSRSAANHFARLQAIIERLEQLEKAEDKLREELEPLVKAHLQGLPIPSDPQLPLIPAPELVEPPAAIFTVEEFHNAVCAKFAAAGKDVPHVKQTAAIFPQLKGREQEFLNYLTPKRLARIEHPGVLPSLVANFVDTPARPAAAVAEPAGPVCTRCGDSGLVGVKWTDLRGAIKAVESGAQYCDCSEGPLTRDLVEPERLRKAGRSA